MDNIQISIQHLTEYIAATFLVIRVEFAVMAIVINAAETVALSTLYHVLI